MASCFENLSLLRYNEITKAFDVLIENTHLKIEVTESELILYICNKTDETININLSLDKLRTWKLSNHRVMMETEILIIKNYELNYFVLEYHSANDLVSTMKLIDQYKHKTNIDNELIETDTKLENISQLECLDIVEVEVATEVSKKNIRKPYKKISIETKEAIVRGLKLNISMAAISKMFELSFSTVNGIYKKFIERGKIEVKRTGSTRPKKVTENVLEFIKELVEKNCTISLRAIQQNILKEHKVTVGISTICGCLKKLNIMKKMKKVCVKYGNHIQGVSATS